MDRNSFLSEQIDLIEKKIKILREFGYDDEYVFNNIKEIIEFTDFGLKIGLQFQKTKISQSKSQMPRKEV